MLDEKPSFNLPELLSETFTDMGCQCRSLGQNLIMRARISKLARQSVRINWDIVTEWGIGWEIFLKTHQQIDSRDLWAFRGHELPKKTMTTTKTVTMTMTDKIKHRDKDREDNDQQKYNDKTKMKTMKRLRENLQKSYLNKKTFQTLGKGLVLETFSKSSSERVPSECRHCRLTSNLFTKEFFTSRQPRYIQFGGWLKISCWISF